MKPHLVITFEVWGGLRAETAAIRRVGQKPDHRAGKNGHGPAPPDLPDHTRRATGHQPDRFLNHKVYG